MLDATYDDNELMSDEEFSKLVDKVIESMRRAGKREWDNSRLFNNNYDYYPGINSQFNCFSAYRCIQCVGEEKVLKNILFGTEDISCRNKNCRYYPKR